MATNRLQDLVQLAQISQLLQGPQLEQQALQQRGQQQNLQTVMGLLGMANEAEMDAARREQMSGAMGVERDRLGVAREQLALDRDTRAADERSRKQSLAVNNRNAARADLMDRRKLRQERELADRNAGIADRRSSVDLVQSMLGNPQVPAELSMGVAERFLPDIGPARAAVASAQNDQVFNQLLPAVKAAGAGPELDTLLQGVNPEVQQRLRATISPSPTQSVGRGPAIPTRDPENARGLQGYFHETPAFGAATTSQYYLEELLAAFGSMFKELGSGASAMR